MQKKQRKPCPCPTQHPPCHKCGCHWLWLYHRGGHLGCPECGTWVFKLHKGVWWPI